MTSAPGNTFVCLQSLRAFWRRRCAKHFLWHISGFFHAELTPTAFVRTMAALQHSHQSDDKEDKEVKATRILKHFIEMNNPEHYCSNRFYFSHFDSKYTAPA